MLRYALLAVAALIAYASFRGITASSRSSGQTRADTAGALIVTAALVTVLVAAAFRIH